MNLQMKATEQYFLVVLFSMLYKMAFTFKSVDKTLMCDHLNESYRVVFHVVLFYAVQGVQTFESESD